MSYTVVVSCIIIMTQMSQGFQELRQVLDTIYGAVSSGKATVFTFKWNLIILILSLGSTQGSIL